MLDMRRSVIAACAAAASTILSLSVASAWVISYFRADGLNSRRHGQATWVESDRGAIAVRRLHYGQTVFASVPDSKWKHSVTAHGSVAPINPSQLGWSVHVEGLGLVFARGSPYDATYGAAPGNRAIPQWRLRIPYWFPLATCVILSCAMVGAYRKRRRVEKHLSQGLCPRCGYDLRASVDRCPECGLEQKKQKSG
jgi:hypothetical protein